MIAFLKRLFARKPKPEGIKNAHLLGLGMAKTMKGLGRK